MSKKQEKIKTYADEVKVKLSGFEIKHLLALLEEEAGESKDILSIKIAVDLYRKLEKVFDENWGN